MDSNSCPIKYVLALVTLGFQENATEVTWHDSHLALLQQSLLEPAVKESQCP